MRTPKRAGPAASFGAPPDAGQLRRAAEALAACEAANLRLAAEVARLEGAAAGWQALAESCGLVAFACDPQGVIGWLTPAAAAILPGAGPGRRLAEATCRLDGIDLAAEARQVLDRGAPTERRVTAQDGAEAWLMRLLPHAAGPGEAAAGVVASFVQAGQPAQDALQATLIEELNHRIRNTAQVVLSVASSTRRHAASLDDFGRSFTGRIVAMGRTQDMVVQSGRAGVPLRDLVRRQLEPYASDPASLVMEGPPVQLTAKAAFALDLVLHELATNAAKHGALSAVGGQVRLAWAEAPAPEGSGLLLHWIETGGPPVAPRPARRGFGSELIERQVRYGLGGAVALEFAATGLRAELVLPPGVMPDAAGGGAAASRA